MPDVPMQIQPSLIHPELRDISQIIPGSDKALPKIGRECVHEFKTDLESCSEWLSMHAEWVQIYHNRHKTMEPFDGASQDSLPILNEACDQFHARASKSMFPGRGRKLLQVIPIGVVDPLSRERADRVQKHMQWQLLDSSSAYRTGKDAMLYSLPLHGSVFTKAVVEPVYGVRGIENVRAVDLIVPYGTGARVIEDLPRKTQIIWMPAWKARRLHAAAYFNQMPTVWQNRTEWGPTEVDNAIDEIMGLSAGGNSGAKDYCLILEQHRWLELDGDGLEEPYVVWVDAISNKVIRIALRYETDDSGVPTRDKEPLEAYTHYQFAPNPDGFYGMGHGVKLGAINKAINRNLRILMDAAMLSSVGNMSGIISKSAGISKGKIELELGKFITTDGPIEDVRSQVMQFQFPGPNPAGLALLEMLSGRADRLGMITETITGSSERVMQPTTVMALLEQSNIIFTAVYERVLMSWEEELRKIYNLNRKFMNDIEYFSVLDIAGQPILGEIVRNDYAYDMQIKPICDPDALTMKERVAKAEASMQMVMQLPFMQMFPIHLRRNAVSYLQALGVEAADIAMNLPSEQDLMMMIQWQMAMQAQAGAEEEAAPENG